MASFVVKTLRLRSLFNVCDDVAVKSAISDESVEAVSLGIGLPHQ